MVFTSFSGRTDSRTHSLTDGQTRLQYASGTVKNGAGGILQWGLSVCDSWIQWIQYNTKQYAFPRTYSFENGIGTRINVIDDECWNWWNEMRHSGLWIKVWKAGTLWVTINLGKTSKVCEINMTRYDMQKFNVHSKPTRRLQQLPDGQTETRPSTHYWHIKIFNDRTIKNR